VERNTEIPTPRSELALSVSNPAFLGAVCHDLRGPLGAIGTWLHVLASGRADTATQQQALAAMKRDVAAQTRLIEQLTDLAAILAGTLLLSIEEVDLALALQELGCELPNHVSSPSVRADPKRLRQLLAILLRAPGEDPQPGARATVSADRDGLGTLTIRARARKGGPGLVGLTLARALAELQAGLLTTSPVAEGIAFELHLPLSERPA
jgi:hypothetical protein